MVAEIYWLRGRWSILRGPVVDSTGAGGRFCGAGGRFCGAGGRFCGAGGRYVN
jgi:hypothetical protein